MKILIAEYNAVGRNQLRRMLELDGHVVLAAADWRAAFALLATHQPEIVILGSDLVDGNPENCVLQIKEGFPNRFVPVLLAMTIQDPISLERFLSSGADDFIDRPYSHLVLKAKIAGFERQQEVYGRLEKYRSVTEQEIKLAKHMFDSVIQKRPDDIRNIHHWSLAAGHFSGDLLIFERTPENHLHIMLGDFTGHGLAAAVGAMPTSDVFYAMTRKGFGIAEIAREINRKLHMLLPTGHFCSASLICLSPESDELTLWNGGLPPVLLVDARREILESVVSQHLPLGIIGDTAFSGATTRRTLCDVEHLIIYSDGLVEAQNAHGEPFGEGGLAEALRLPCSACTLLETVKAGIIDFLDGLEPHDDISLLSIKLGAAA